MYGSQFDGVAAFSGGGFMPSQATQTTDPSPSSYNKNRDTLTPLTVKQITKALSPNDDKVNLLIDGVGVSDVKLVGMMFNKMERVTDVTFVLDDGTGRIDCQRWVNDSVDTKEMEALMNGTYVRVHGQLKGLQGKKFVVFGIKPVTDFDEITHHFVECIYVHSYNTKKLQASSCNPAHMPNSAVTSQAYQTAPSNQFTGHHVANGFKGIEKLVLDYLILPACTARESGVHQEELVKQLGIPLDKILVAINSLVDEGLVYSSIDDYHYKSTVNG